MTVSKEMNTTFPFWASKAASIDDKRRFVTCWLDFYENQTHWKDDNLSEYFAQNYGLFTTDDFEKIDGDNRRKLSDLSKSRGVHANKERNILIVDAFYAVVKDNLPWPEEEKHSEKTALTDGHNATYVTAVEKKRERRQSTK